MRKDPLFKVGWIVKKLLIIHPSANKNTKNYYGCTPLRNFVRFIPCLEAASDLLFQGADVNAKDNRGKTPLHYSVNKKYETGNKYLELILMFNAGAYKSDDKLCET